MFLARNYNRPQLPFENRFWNLFCYLLAVPLTTVGFSRTSYIKMNAEFYIFWILGHTLRNICFTYNLVIVGLYSYIY